MKLYLFQDEKGIKSFIFCDEDDLNCIQDIIAKKRREDK